MRTEGLAFRPLGTQTVQVVAARPNTLWSIPWEQRGSARHENRLTCDIILNAHLHVQGPSENRLWLRPLPAGAGVRGGKGTMNYSPHLASGLGFPNSKHSSRPPRGLMRNRCFNEKQ